MNHITKNLLLKLQTLPKYQLERRIDIFVLEKLNTVFTKKFSEPTYFIYPEFPLRSLDNIPKDAKVDNDFKQLVDTLVERKTSHNTNVDYLLASKDTFYMVEFKTDSKSFNHASQLLYYSYYMRKSFKELYLFFKEQLATDKQDSKWKIGLEYLCINYENLIGNPIEMHLENKLKLIYLAPSKVEELPVYNFFKNVLGNQLIFVSLIDFANKIEDDEVLKQLLINIDETDRKNN